MDRLLLKVLLLITVFGGSVNCARNRRMIDGSPVVRSQFPYMAGLQYKRQFWCGASIISKDAVLTAAHCVFDNHMEMRNIKVRVGGIAPIGPPTISDPVQIYEMRGYQKHFAYGQKAKHDADLAIIWIDGFFVFGPTVAPINLAPSDYVSDFKSAVALGWGRTQSRKISNVLRMIEISVLLHPICVAQWEHRFTSRMICAWVNEKNRSKSICDGDSGGPLAIHYGNDPSKDILIGVVSFSDENCNPMHTQVFSKVGAMRRWIDETLKVGPFKPKL